MIHLNYKIEAEKYLVYHKYLFTYRMSDCYFFTLIIAIVKDFISKAMKGEYNYFYNQFEDQVLKYFFGLKRMLCLVQSLLKNVIS